ncbi:Protein kinase domain-containing protein [Mycena kentingensis (nom. inval.)]|nr:Protein kinase domain-containing protein [Mycena kentingensis (nom. inval.)]
MDQQKVYEWEETYYSSYTPWEEWWVQYQPLLYAKGYQLRRRFRAGWIPSWSLPGSGFDSEDSSYSRAKFEDSVVHMRKNVLDAVRISDGEKVVLRRVVTATQELGLLRHLETLCDPRNRTVPLLDVIALPDDEFMLVVIPFLRKFNDPVFRHLREAVDCMRQYFLGLEFLHFHNIAHRDACGGNMMMDATHVVPSGFHFSAPHTTDGDHDNRVLWRDRCSVSPVNYFFIDFGLSSYHEEGCELARDVGAFSQDETVPELSKTIPYNPFKVDIYQLGRVFLRESQKHPPIDVYFGSLLDAMTEFDPAERPSAAQVVLMFENLASNIPEDKLDERMEILPQTPCYSGESDAEYELDPAPGPALDSEQEFEDRVQSLRVDGKSG